MSCRGAVLPVAVRPALPALLALLLVLAVLPLFPRPAGAATPSLLADLYAAPQPDPDSLLLPLGALNDGRTVFTAVDIRHGREPWVSDGTAAGTRRLGDLCPGPCSGVPERSGLSVGSRVFFLVGAGSTTAERQLWVTDGTVEGTRPLPVETVAFIPPRMQGDGTGRLFLLGRLASGEDGLWVSDGTTAGTRRLPHPAVPGGATGLFHTTGLFGGRLGPGRVWFVAGTGVGGTQEPWVSDGTAAGTRRLAAGSAVVGPPLLDPFSPAYRFAPLDDGGGVMLQKLGPEPGLEGRRAVAVWETDGTPAGTRRSRVLEDQWLLPADPVTGPRAAFVTSGDDGLHRLWTSDGTAAGTEPVFASVDGASPGVWSAGRLFYFVHGAELEGGWELWVHVPGEGEEQLGTFCVGACSADSRLVPFAGGVTFLAGTRSRQELWASDGTAAGTRRVATLCDEGCGSGTSVLAGAGTERLLLAVGRETSWELLVSDGTPAGTLQLASAFAGPGPGDRVVPLDGGLLVSADDGAHGGEPWVSDGTAAGTHLLANLATPVGNGDALPRGLTPWGDRVLFFARDTGGWGVWVSDGTGAGTRRLHRLANSAVIDSDPAAFAPRPLLLVGELFFFVQPVEDRGSGDLKVVDLAAGQLRHLGRFPGSFGPAVALGDGLLWGVVSEGKLVASDGTLAGTAVLPDLRLKPGEPMASFGDGVALFSGFRQETGAESGSEFGLWRTDGTVTGTRRVFLTADPITMPHALVALGSDLAVFARHRQDDAGRHIELWRTDGTAGGNLLLTTFSEPPDSFQLQGPFELTAVGDEVLLFMGRGGLELWRTDGTPAGTALVTRPRPQGEPLYFVSGAVPYAGGLFFVGGDLWYGHEPWVSDGTAAGTRLVADLLPGDRGSVPRATATRGGELFFVATDGEERLRVWVSDGTAAGTFPLDDADGPVRPALDPQLAMAGDRVVYGGESLELGNELWVLPASGVAPPPPGPAPSLPPPPRQLTARVAESGVVVLTWVKPAPHLHGYLVEARTPASPDFRAVSRERGQFTTGVLDGLPPGVPHTFRVRAVNTAGASAPSNEVSATPQAGPVEPCLPADEHLCLLGGRFRVTAYWRDPRSGDHGTGVARPIPGADRSGTFWFFHPANVELIVKALDGTFVNRRWWVFAGGLTDVETWIEVTDILTGASNTYHSANRDLCGFADTSAFAGEPAEAFPLPAAGRVAADGAPLDLVDGRFRVEVEWRDPRSGDSGSGQSLPWSANTGFFWFFHRENVELVVKVLDGRPVNGQWWVFFGGLTDVAYTVRVTDTATGGTRSYEHPAGNLCGRADTGAFPAP